METMRAAVFTETRAPLEVTDVEAPTTTAEGVVVETEACGICRSDWHVWNGDWGWLGVDPEPGQILGHEPAGRVIDVGDDVETVSEGDRIAVPFNLADGTCSLCRNGRSNVCTDGQSLGLSPSVPGAFAERVHVPKADYNAVVLPDGVSPVEMAGLGCRFMTAFHALVHRADVTPGDWVAVHGCGGVGLSAVHVADALGADVVAVDIADPKLETALEMGARETVNAETTDDVPGAVAALTDGGADVSMDALGIAETCRNSVLSLDRLGQHLQVGLTTSDEGGTVELPTDLVATREIEFIGSKGMPVTRYDEILRMVERDRIDPGAVVSETVSLADVPDALARMTDFETEGIPVVTEF